MMKHERGVALLQALLLSMIVSLLALQLTLTARDQIETVRLLEERLQADLLTHSLEMEALFNLLTVEDLLNKFMRTIVSLPITFFLDYFEFGRTTFTLMKS